MNRAPKKFDSLCTVTIQGGGIYGFGLLGQLAAVEKTNLTPIAYAGTSAGALIATLAWAGYPSQKIKDVFKDWCDKGEIVSLIGPFPPEAEDVAKPDAVREAARTLPRLLTELSGNGSKKGWISSKLLPLYTKPRDLFRIWRIYNGLKKSIRSRGLFRVDKLREKIDILLLDRLNELRSNLNMNDLAKDHRPTFRDFFEVTYQNDTSSFQPALFLTATNLCRFDVEIIDSLSSAHADSIISDVVRASIAYPVAFKPQELQIWRDTKSGLPANRKSYYDDTARLDTEVFIDGGVIANFPVWALTKRLRKALYGHDESGIDNILVGDEQYGNSPDSPVEESVWELKGDLASPLRMLAHRPMIHIGLQLLTDAEFARHPNTLKSDSPFSPGFFSEKTEGQLADANDYYKSLIDVIVSGSRSRLESHLNIASQDPHSPRLYETLHSYRNVGWEYGLLDVHRLQSLDLDRMFDNGYRAGVDSFKEMDFSIPPDSEQFYVDFELSRTSIQKILKRSVHFSAVFLNKFFQTNNDSPNNLRATVYVAIGSFLWRTHTDPGNNYEESSPLRADFSNSYVGFAFTSRTPTMFSHVLRRTYELTTSTKLFPEVPAFKDGALPTVSFVVPIVDRSDMGASDLFSVTDHGHAAQKLGFYPFGKRYNGAFFGTLVVDAHVSSRDLVDRLRSFDSTSSIDDLYLSSLFNSLVLEADRLGDVLSQRFGSRE